MSDVFKVLDQLGIAYDTYEHPAVFTVEEAKGHRLDEQYGENKNLFLRNQKGSRHYLVTLAASKSLDLKGLAEKINEDRLSFASERRMEKYLGVTPGSVSPFGLLNDTEAEVVYILDKDLWEYEKLGFHPNDNTRTLILATSDFRKYLDWLENEVITASL